MTDYAERFNLVYATTTGITEGDQPFAFISNGNIVITDTDDDATLQIIDVMGRVIVSSDGHTRSIPTVGMVLGVYVLRLIKGDDVRVQKVVVR